MWARVVEFMLGCWLAISPFVFRHDQDERLLLAMDWGSAALIILFALLSYWAPLRRMHLATLLVAVAMVAVGRLYFAPDLPPGAQNHIVVGLLLLMFALVPSHSSDPPPAWQAKLEQPA
jgi:hypothetical protein